MDTKRYKESFRKEVTEKIKRFINTGTSFTLLGIPGEGKTDFINFITSHLNQYSSKILTLRIHTNELVDISELDFYKNFLLKIKKVLESNKKLFSKDQYPKIESHLQKLEKSIAKSESLLVYNDIKESLDFIINRLNPELHLGIFIDKVSKLKNLPSSFFESLMSIRAVNKFHIAYIFIDDVDLTKVLNYERVGDMYDYITNEVIWLPFPTRKEAESIITNCEKLFDYKLSPKEKDFVWRMTRGHASLIKYLTLYIMENKDDRFDVEKIIKFSAIKTRIKKIFEMLDYDQKVILNKIAENKLDYNHCTKKDKNIVKELANYNILEIDSDNNIEIFSPLITRFLIKKGFEAKKGTIHKPSEEKNRLTSNSDSHQVSNKKDEDVSLTLKEDTVYIESKKIEKDLSKTEFDVIKHFIENRGELVSREDIAQVMWGDRVAEKYSDWAIDRIISRLRKKLGDDAYKPKYIKTLRGRGFKLIS